jgi:putative endonuclease
MTDYKVYVLKAKPGETYIGQSKDSEKRLERHNRHSSKATRFEKDWCLVHEESFASRALAVKREKFLKSGDGRRVLRSKGI